MRANGAGQVIGQAMTDYSATSTDQIGKVMVFIKNTYYDGYDQNDNSTTTATSTTLANGNLADRFTHIVRLALEKLTNVFLDMTLWVKTLKTENVEASKQICIDDVCVTKEELMKLKNNSSNGGGSTNIPENTNSNSSSTESSSASTSTSTDNSGSSGTSTENSSNISTEGSTSAPTGDNSAPVTPSASTDSGSQTAPSTPETPAPSESTNTPTGN
jgi:hypothetical protein